MVEKNWVMLGWDGLTMGRWRLRDGGGRRSLRAAGREGGERRGWGLGSGWERRGGFMGSWLVHTSQCKALQVCSGRARELGTGSSAGSSS